MFVKESLYGWGVCDITMPRAASDIFSDRRKRVVRIFFSDRRKADVQYGILSSISAIIIHDFPWIQSLVLGVISLSCFAGIYIISKTIPEHPNKQPSKPVDITINLIEDKSIKAPLVVEKIEEKTKLQPIADIKLIMKRKSIPIKDEIAIPDKTIPDIRVSPKIRKGHLIASKTDLSESSNIDVTPRHEEIRISGPVIRKRDYGINQIGRKMRSKYLDSMYNSFSKKLDAPAVIVSQANRSKKKYAIDTSNQKLASSSDRIFESDVFDCSHLVKYGDIAVPETDQGDERYLLEKSGRPFQSRVSTQPGEIPMSFGPQNKEKNLTLIPPREAKSVSRRSKAIRGNPMAGDQALDFSGGVTNEIDPSHIISLKELSVCEDPEEEFQLKAKLAALLHGPSKLKTNGITFFFKYPESGYTINVDIYNPEGQLFQDRCSVLRLATESIMNTRSHFKTSNRVRGQGGGR